MSTLRTTMQRGEDGVVYVALAGAIDEASDLEALFSRLDSEAVFDLAAVERINSIGVHRWIPLMTNLSRRRRTLIENISYPMVMQANSVANLFGAATVRSCLAPYYCPKCNDSRMARVVAEEVSAHPTAPPERRCEQCQCAMEFDELDGYFTFFRAKACR